MPAAVVAVKKIVSQLPKMSCARGDCKLNSVRNFSSGLIISVGNVEMMT